ncbi:MAG: hypothetical protein KC776_38145 [Myxococcales bacterium]|nr:hypothetical protein [Myxococcales bacterium]MCB9579968.1 hypothetical protein [Polyangiaceae bacterium]
MWRVGAAYAFTQAELRFDGEQDYDLEQHAAVASLSRRFGERTTLQLAAGAVLAGELSGEGSSWDVLPGPVVSLSSAYRIIGGKGEVPFVTGTLAFGASFPRTRAQSYDERSHFSAFDLRAGVLAGATLFEAWSPYAAARAFGGPVLWHSRGEDHTGSDRHHYAIGVGSSLSLGPRFALTAEAIFLGERSYSGGISYAL